MLEVVREGMPFEVNVRDYFPELTVEDVRACVQHALEVVAAEEIHVTPLAA